MIERIEPSAEEAAILVVDDTSQNLLAMEVALAGLPHRIVTASSGAEALRDLLQQDFALVLLDVQMPGMDGYETARMIRSRGRNRHIPIIFITAYDRDEAEVLDAYSLGAVDFLFKPVRSEVLRAKVNVFVELQRRTAEVARQAEQLREHERRQHEEELTAQRRELEAAALRRQMEEQRRIDRRKDEFIAVLGHELRNPLAALVTGFAVIDQLNSDAETRARARGVIDRQLHHLVRLVDDLIDVSRINSGKLDLARKDVLVSDVIESAVAIATPSIEAANHHLEVVLPPEPLVVHADDVRMAQVVSNLLANAARYTDPYGHITVAAKAEGPRAIISVSDDGRGLDQEALEHVFDMFAQAEPGRGGLGVGLTLARRLVELQGGTLSAHSAGPGRGSRFDIRLPLIDCEALPVCVTPPAPVSCEVLDLLVVEDNDDLRETLSELLRGWGHRVRVAGTMAAGLEMIDLACPDVVLVDLGLPDGDGCELAVRVRGNGGLGSRVRLVALSGFAQHADRQRALAAGFDDHLGKPPDLAQLRHALRRPTP